MRSTNATVPEVYFRYAAVLAFGLACGAYITWHSPPKQWSAPVPQINRAMKGDRFDKNAPETYRWNGPYRLYGSSRIANSQ